jgi:hypothetical protein
MGRREEMNVGIQLDVEFPLTGYCKLLERRLVSF